MAEWDVVSQTPVTQDPWSVVSETPAKRIEDAWSVVDQRPLAAVANNQGGSSAPPTVAQPDAAAKPGLFERALQTFRGIHPVATAAGEGAVEKFGAPYLGEWMQRHEPTAKWASENPALAAGVSVLGAPIEIPSKLFNAAIGAYKGGVTEAGNQLGVDTSRFARDTAGMAEYALQQPQHLMRPASPRAWTEPVKAGEPVAAVPGEVTPPRPWTEGYHGSATPFENLDQNKAPHYFADNPEAAGGYAQATEAQTLARMRGEPIDTSGNAPHIMPARLNMQKPFEVLATDLEGVSNARNPEWLRANGYDSAIIRDAADPKATEYVIPSAEQVAPKYAAEPVAEPSTQPGLARRAAQTAEKIFSPETVDKNAEAAVATIRAATGKAARDTATTDAALEPYRAKINALEPEAKLSFIDYVEGRSKPETALTDPTLQPVADALRTAFEERRAKLEAFPEGDRMGFIADYFPHMWKNPEVAQTFLPKGTKEGSGKFTKERTIPTVADGIRAGLEPKYADPLDATIAYVTNADRFIATQQILETAKEQGHIKYFAPGKQPEGWMEIKGRLGNSNPGGKAYAPEGWARIYNNYVSRGFHDIDPALGDAMTGARRISNSVTALELGLSGYHAFTMAQEAMVNQLAKGIGNLRTGHPIEALKDVIKTPVAPVTLALKGKQIQDVYLGKKEGTPEAQQIAQLLEEGGARAKGFRHAADYEFSGKGSYVTALKRGALKGELLADVETIKNAPISGTTKVAFRNIGRVLDTVAQPLFEKYIPLIKNGAFYENISAWLKQNADATPAQQQRAARQILDSIDNRFGEMVSDNVFWNKAIKEIAMLSLRSWSWTVGGSFREIMGGGRDVLRGAFKPRDPEQIGPNDKRWTQKMDYVIALPIVYAGMSAVVQGLMAGKAPENMRDLLAPQTGGVDANSGEAERLLLPGYMKDVFGFYKHPVDEITNKFATLPTKVVEVARNKNWRSDPIRSPRDPEMDYLTQQAPIWLKDYWKYATESFGPITVRNLAKGQKEGSAIPWPLAAMGTRTAPRWLMDPEGYEKMLQGVEKSAWTRKERFEKRDRARYGGTE